MAELIVFFLALVLFVLVACLIMVATHVMFDFFSVTIIFLAFILMVFGVVFGLFVALKNTFIVYRDIYKTQKGR